MIFVLDLMKRPLFWAFDLSGILQEHTVKVQQIS
jgi:hypothetical protein